MDNKYLEVFIDESQEHLQMINENLLILEKNPEDIEIVNVIFRGAHTLKGMSASMGFEELADLTHKMENVLDAIRNHKITVTTDVLDVIFQSVDYLEEMIGDISEGGSGKKDVTDIVNQLQRIEKGETTSSVTTAPVKETPAVEVSNNKYQHMYSISVSLDEKTQLKGVRAVMVLESLKASGEILDINPAMTKLEEGEFESTFSLVFASNEKEENVKKTVESILDIEKCTVTTFSPNKNAPLSFNLEEFERAVVKQAKEQGLYSYKITTEIDKESQMKAARAFMVFDKLENVGDIVKSVPSVEEIENEDFGNTFILLVTSTKEKGYFEKELLNISEINRITIEKFSLEEETNEVVKEEKTEETKNKAVGEKETPKKPSTKTIRVNLERIDRLMNLFEELVIDRGRLEQISNELKNSDLAETVERINRTSSNLRDIVLNMRMMPVDNVFNRFPRMVRSLAKDLGKKINLIIEGADTEMDRNVIDEIGDPLVHLIRNSLDHGVEKPETRRDKGKDETGTIILRAYHSGNHVFIDIIDDGAGINKEKVLEKAIEKNVITREKAATLEDKEIYQLIFASGFSTADKISDVSGRGVGLDVVMSTIESLGGRVSVDSKENEGSTFSIELPLTLSILPSMLVEVQNEKYAIPLSSIIETSIIDQNEVKESYEKKVINFRGKIIPLIFLDELFSIPKTKERNETYSLVIVKKGDKIAALVVDSFIGQQEIVLKSLGEYVKNVFAVSGATILGNGQVALIIDCNALVK